MKPNTLVLPLALALALALLVSTAAFAQTLDELPAVKLDGKTLTTARHLITLADTGLPEQIAINAQPHELPIELRDNPAEVGAVVLQRIGRGPQLRQPASVVVVSDGGERAAQVATAAKPAVKGRTVNAQSKLTAGEVNCTLDLLYGVDGTIMATLTYQADAKVDQLALLLPLSGPVDVAIANQPLAGDGPVGLNTGQGVVWGNSADDAGQRGRAAPGVLKHLFVGNGDRGFTLLTDGGKGWQIDPDQSMAVVERDDQDRYTLRLRVINHTVTLSGSHTVKFALMTHPSTHRPDNFRDLQWQSRDDIQPATPALNLSTRDQAKVVAAVRGDAVAFESLAPAVHLAGPAGVELAQGARDVTDVYTPAIYRYLTGTHTGLLRHIQADNLKITRPGGDPAPDRTLLGRALLHDAGVDLTGLAHGTQSLALMNKLHALGVFDEAASEFIPYWRSDEVVRYGPAFSADDAFATTTQNPYADVRVSVYRVHGGKTAIFIIANEGDQPVRDVLYLLNDNRLLAGSNVIKTNDVFKRNIDFTKVPKKADWRRGNVIIGRPSDGGPALEDLETGAAVTGLSTRKNTSNVEFGRLFVPARDFRVLIATSDKKFK